MERLSQYRKQIRASQTSRKLVLLRHLTPACWEVTLNQPEILNAFTDQMLSQLEKLIPVLAKPPSKVIIFSGAGGKSFSAGGNVKQILQDIALEAKVQISVNHRNIIQKYVELAVPKVAIWNGIVMGGGLGFSFNATIRIATEQTLLSLPQTLIGFFPNVGGTHLLSRLLDNPAYGLFLGLTGKRLRGKETIQFGVATHYLESKQLKWFYSQMLKRSEAGMSEEELTGMVDELLPPVQGIKMSEATKDAILKIFKFDSIQNVLRRAKEESLKGNKLGQYCTQIFKRVSPFGLKLTFQIMKRTRSLSYREDKELELKVISKILDPEIGDLYEGVRAFFVQKRKPQWKYKSVEEVPDSLIRSLLD